MLRTTLVLSAAACSALAPSRRALLRAAPVVAAPFIVAPANAADDFETLLGASADFSRRSLYKAASNNKKTYKSKPGELQRQDWEEDAFVGRYTDPINHPGGVRDITLTDTYLGEFRLVKVEGGGGRGEPPKYVLPGLIDANRIVLDFGVAPKNGPPNLVGVLTPSKPGRPAPTYILWPDGNKWPLEKK